MRKKPMVLLSAILAAAILAVACGGGQATPTPMPEIAQPVDRISKASVYDPNTAHFEGYWYSRYNLGHFVMRSGLGVQLMPPPDKVKAMMEMAGISEGPANPYLLQAVYASGDPHLVNAFNGNESDFSNFRWDPAGMDTTVTPEAMGQTIIKEVIWAKSFATDVEGAVPMNHFRALVLSTEAVAQANFAATNLMSNDGLFLPAWRDGEILEEEPAAQDQMVMLWALSELADYASGKYGWYAAPLSNDNAHAMADNLMAAIADYDVGHAGFLTDLPTRDLGVALTALSSYSSYAQDGPSRTLAMEKLIPSLAQELIGRMDGAGLLIADGGFNQVSTQATAIQGLVYAYKVTSESAYREAALRSWSHMETLWDEVAGLYSPYPGAVDYTYSARDVGDIGGAVNSLLNGLNLNVNQRYATFFNTVVNRSGLLIAEGLATGGDRDEDTIPIATGAGGPFGQAPVFATEVVYNTATVQWEVSNPRFTTADAMYLSNQLMWMSTWAGRPAIAGHGIPVPPAQT